MRFDPQSKKESDKAPNTAMPHSHEGKPGSGTDRGGKSSDVVVLEDGGSVAIINVVDAGAPPERFKDEAGLKEQVAPAIFRALHASATVLEAALLGVIVTIVLPVCPAITGTVAAPGTMLKSGIVTLT
jgi:hypothetical protein